MFQEAKDFKKESDFIHKMFHCIEYLDEMSFKCNSLMTWLVCLFASNLVENM